MLVGIVVAISIFVICLFSYKIYEKKIQNDGEAVAKWQLLTVLPIAVLTYALSGSFSRWELKEIVGLFVVVATLFYVLFVFRKEKNTSSTQ